MPNQKDNLVNLAEVREANQLENGEIGPYLRKLAAMADRGEMGNLVMSWTMANGDIHYGYAQADGGSATDGNLRLLGLCEVIKGALVDILTTE